MINEYASKETYILQCLIKELYLMFDFTYQVNGSLFIFTILQNKFFRIAKIYEN